MPKFNKRMIKGISEPENESTEVRLGAGLLNDVSKKQVKMKIEHIPRYLIDKHEDNDISITEIESLAWSIQHIGLLNPLHVKRTEDGRYKLLGGERRLTAIDQLIADSKVEEWNEESLIPAIVQNFDDIDLPLDDAMKERFAMITSNKEARKYTDADKLAEIRAWKEIIAALREAGVETISTTGEDGSEQDIRIKGEKTRDILARTTNLSRGTINNFEKVENQGSESVKEALLNNDINLTTANKIIDAAATEDEQEEILTKVKETGKLVTDKNTKDADRKKTKIETHEEGGISLLGFRKDIKDIMSILKKDTVYLDNDEMMRYYNCIRELQNILSRQGE